MAGWGGRGDRYGLVRIGMQRSVMTRSIGRSRTSELVMTGLPVDSLFRCFGAVRAYVVRTAPWRLASSRGSAPIPVMPMIMSACFHSSYAASRSTELAPNTATRRDHIWGFTSLAPPSSRVAAGSLECLATPPTPEPAVASQIIHHLLPPRARGTTKWALRSLGEVG